MVEPAVEPDLGAVSAPAADEDLEPIVVDPRLPYLEVDHLQDRADDAMGAELRIVDSVTFALQPGASLGIVGESGSGKTMLCRSFTGHAVPLRGGRHRRPADRSPAAT